VLIVSLTNSLPSVLAAYSVSLEDSSISVRILDDLRQGVPNPAANDTQVFTDELPKVSFVLVGPNATEVESALSLNIKSKSPQAALVGFYLAVSSNGSWVHVDMRFEVTGAITGPQEFQRADLSWRSLLLSEDLKEGNFSFNLLGSNYFAEPVENLAQPSTLPVAQTRRWYFNGLARTPTQVFADVGSMSLFNYTSLSKPLESWQREIDYSPLGTKFSTRGGFNLTFLGTIREPGEEFTQAFTAVYNPEVVIEVKGLAEANGDFLNIETGKGFPAEMLMLTLVVAIPIPGVATYVYERRITRRPLFRKGRGKRGGGN